MQISWGKENAPHNYGQTWGPWAPWAPMAVLPYHHDPWPCCHTINPTAPVWPYHQSHSPCLVIPSIPQPLCCHTLNPTGSVAIPLIQQFLCGHTLIPHPLGCISPLYLPLPEDQQSSISNNQQSNPYCWFCWACMLFPLDGMLPVP